MSSDQSSDHLNLNSPTLSKKLAQRIAQQTRTEAGRVFTPFDFLDLGSPHSVGMAFLRLVRGQPSASCPRTLRCSPNGALLTRLRLP